MQYVYPFQAFQSAAVNVDKLFPQRHPLYPEIRIVYRYGERFYSAAAVDRVFAGAAEELHLAQTQAITGKSGSPPATAVTTVIAEPVPTVTEPSTNASGNGNGNDNDNTCNSVSSSASHHNSGPGSRAIGKRNQQFYLPDGWVKLLHVSVDPGGYAAASTDDGAHSHKWYGRYDKDKNTITRTTTDYDAPHSVDVAEYETLSHFAQEHDKECWGSDYIPSNTHNVWKNTNFLYFNTVTLKWEPLNKLR